MNRSKLAFLLVIGIATAIAASFIIAKGIRIKYVFEGVQTPENPLELALANGVSDEEFERNVKEYREWIHHRPADREAFNWQVLANCALLEKTNYVRTLIAHGASVEDAIKSLSEVGATNAINLLRLVQSEAGSNNVQPR